MMQEGGESIAFGQYLSVGERFLDKMKSSTENGTARVRRLVSPLKNHSVLESPENSAFSSQKARAVWTGHWPRRD